MASKFFTWTKGDRHNAAEALRSGGIVPIPVECISIKGMDYARTAKGSSKANKRPTPLALEGSPQASSKHSSRTTDSIALQDAALQSATNLMHAMNDMLRSPPMSAHIFSQNYHSRLDRPDMLRPTHGRPRSRTVPSTPLAEAPMCEPAELEGSFPMSKKPSIAHSSIDGKPQGFVFEQSPGSASFGPAIVRPHSSPQEATHPIIPDSVNVSTPRVSPKSNLLSPQSQSSPRSKSVSPRRNLGTSLTNDSAEDTLVASDGQTLSLSTQRPSLSNILDEALKSDGSFATSAPLSRHGTGDIITKSGTLRDGQATPSLLQQAESEAVLMDQISNLRASHDAHISSLRESHEKEIASHKSYISFLESRRPLHTPSLETKQALTIDTSTSTTRVGEALTSGASESTNQSFELSLEGQKRTSEDASQSSEALKRKLSLARKAQADAIDVRRERDLLRDTVGRNDRRILQLKDIIRKAKENEKALKNATTDLEARLLLANNERTDVLEGYHEACAQVESLGKRERELSSELERVSSRESQDQAVEGEGSEKTTPVAANTGKGHDRTTSDAGAALVKDCDALLKQVQELRQTVAQKDAHIQRLQEVVSVESDVRKSTAAQSLATQSKFVSELQSSLEGHKQMLAAARADSERYNSLLHHELRRQSRSAAEKASLATPNIEAQASAVVTDKMARLTYQSKAAAGKRSNPDTPTEPLVALLEKELEHCIKELIVNKSDLKVYKKDLKRAHAKIESLQAMNLHRPPTPDGESAASGLSNPSPGLPRNLQLQSAQYPNSRTGTPDSGLGISVPGSQHTPTKTVAAATASALLSPTPAPKFAAASTPSRPKTPLSTHKKLPKPPPAETERPLPATPPPNSSIKLQRNETLRSLSESIISSYTKREMPDLPELSSTPPSRNRSSAPLQSLGSPMASVSKYSSPQPTPRMGLTRRDT